MQVLTVPQWSFGRDRILFSKFGEVLAVSGCTVHFAKSYLDHNRTVTAFSGNLGLVFSTIRHLMEISLDSIDLNRHVGAHPRIGALDVCPFVPIGAGAGSELLDLHLTVQGFAKSVAERWEIPVYLYEKSESGTQESELPQLRKGGFGGLMGRELRPDYGPNQVHPRWGIATIGIRDFLLTAALNFCHDDGSQARKAAQLVRYLRLGGDAKFAGVRAMAMNLASLEQAQVKLELTMPNQTTLDEVLDRVIHEVACNGPTLAGAELIGPIRPVDVPKATRVWIQPEQIVEGCA